MEPVEIDIRLKQNVDTEGKKVTQSLNEIAAATERAKSMIDRHQAGIVELKKDLVELGIAYKKATTKEAKSEILTEIELTKKNIIDETAAIKVLKAEIASLNKMPKTSALPDTSKMAKAGMQYGGLNMSMQQIVRELPAATMGLNMFFLAISNNIPMATDAIKRARLENEALKASGASTVPVWKQLFSAIVSWQSLMMVGITVASMYGKEILQAFSKGSEAAERAKESTKKFNDAFAQSAADPLAKVNQLSEQWNKLGDNLDEKKKFVDANKDAFRDLGVEVNNVKDAENLLVDNVDAFRQAMVAKAMSVAAMQVATDKYQEYFKKMREAEQVKPLAPSAGDKLKSAFLRIGAAEDPSLDFSQTSPVQMARDRKTGLQAEANVIKTEGDALITEANKQNAAYKKFLEEAGIKILETETKNRERSHTAAYNSESDFQKLIYSLTEKSESMLIGLKEDSLAKRLELIQQEKDKELEAIREKEVAIIEEYNRTEKKRVDEYNKENPKAKKTFTALSTKPGDIGASLTAINPAQAKQLADATIAVTDAFQKKVVSTTQSWNDDMLKLANQYATKSEQIRFEYAQKIKDLEAKGLKEVAVLAAVEMEKKISEEEKKLIEETDIYKLAVNEKLKLTKEMNDKLIQLVKDRIEANKDLSQEDKDKLTEKVNASDLGRSSSALDGLIKSFTQLKTAKDEVAAAEKLGDAEGAAKASLKVEDLKKGIEGYGQAIVGVFNQAGSGIVGIMDQLGAFTEEEKEMATDVVNTVSSAGTLAVGIMSGDISSIISGAVGVISGLVSIFDSKGRDIKKKQKAIEKNIDSLTAAYSRLQRQVDKALGTDVYSAQKSQIENLKKQIQENEAWIEQENRKKRRKRDKDAIADRKKEIDDLKNQIEDVTQAIADDLAQTTAKDITNQISDAIVQGINGGSDAFEVMGDVVNSILKDAVTNALEKQFLEKQMGEAVSYLSSAMADGALSDSERKQFSEMVTAAGNNYNEAINAYKDILGNSESARTGASKGIATASQDSIDTLNGGVYALRTGVADIRNNSREQTLVVRTISTQLDTIADNTEPIAEMAGDIKKLSNDINDIKTRGLNVKV